MQKKSIFYEICKKNEIGDMKNMKKINVFKAIVIALIFIIPGSVFANVESINTMVSIDPSAQMVEKGETFTVSVYIMPSEPITGVTLNYLYYDANLIHANSVAEAIFSTTILHSIQVLLITTQA